MKVTVISDTHAGKLTRLGKNLISSIKSSDAVIHAGDIGSESFYCDLNSICKKLYAVKGNNDFSMDLPKTLCITLDELKICVVHGDGARWMDMGDYLLKLFSEQSPQLIIHGHTHHPVVSDNEGVTVLNPGSATENRFVNYNSYAELTIEKGKFAIEIIKVG